MASSPITDEAEKASHLITYCMCGFPTFGFDFVPVALTLCAAVPSDL